MSKMAKRGFLFFWSDISNFSPPPSRNPGSAPDTLDPKYQGQDSLKLGAPKWLVKC